MERRKELEEIFENVSTNERKLVNNLIEEVIFLEERMTELKKLPFLRIHPKNSARQETTAAAKQYKECSQSYMNAIRILVGIIHKQDGSEEDDLLKKLGEFMG